MIVILFAAMLSPLRALQPTPDEPAAEFFTRWLGPRQHVVITVPDHGRLFTLGGDRSRDRAQVAQLARQYWWDGVRVRAEDEWFARALVRYTAVRAMADVIEGDHFAAPPSFGGLVAFPVRFAPLTSDWWDRPIPIVTFPELKMVLGDEGATEARSLRATRALQTLERHIGRPMLDAAVAEYAHRLTNEPLSPRGLMTAIHDVTGRDVTWFLDAAFDPDASYDYSVAVAVTNAALPYEAEVTIQRLGTAMFSGTAAEPLPGFEEGRAVELLVHFADGSELREHWDGRAALRRFTFVSASAIVAATVDPELVLLVDEDWENNRWTAQARPGAAAWQWSLLWMAWVQHVMLSLTAVV